MELVELRGLVAPVPEQGVLDEAPLPTGPPVIS